MRLYQRRLRLAKFFAVLGLWFGCAGHGKSARSPVFELRQAAEQSSDSELLGRWLIAELISLDGTAQGARRARQRLDAHRGAGVFTHLARALDDGLHGRLDLAPHHYLRAAEAAWKSTDPGAPLFAWFSIHRAIELRYNAARLWEEHKAFVNAAISDPRHIGWRARAELVDWSADQGYLEARRDLEEQTRELHGCVKNLRLAGPFGRSTPADALRHFAAEQPGPWPVRWKPEPGVGEAPRVLLTHRDGCLVSADEPVGPGIFYAETYIDVNNPIHLIITAQGTLAMWVDDRNVLDRDPRIWGADQKIGAAVELSEGRHRILIRLIKSDTAIRLLYPDGRPSTLESSTDPQRPYSLVPPRLGPDPNLVSEYVTPDGLRDPPDDITRLVAAYLASVDGEGDIASLLIGPLVNDPRSATGPSLAIAGQFVKTDPVFNATVAADRSRTLMEKAATKDARLWEPRLDLALGRIEHSGPTEAIKPLKTLVQEFPEVSAIAAALARLYNQMNWTAEYAELVEQMGKRFPEHEETLQALAELYDARGELKQREAVVSRIQKVDPDNEVVIALAIKRRDFDTALAELKRLSKRRPERNEFAARLYDLMARAGHDSETWNKLAAAIKKEPRNQQARLDWADAHYAAGQQTALTRTLVDAVQAGAPTGRLKDALDLIEGSSELEPYRLSALDIIRDYEKSSKHMPGTAARVLDYAAVWVHDDGSSRMLEHEILRMQSPEAINQFAEHPRLDGLVLHMRVIKRDGRILEPEMVAGKPTVTMPHLEVGDYIETEHITNLPGDGQQGASYLGPRWFFREENIAYARSEFLVIAPSEKRLMIEIHGSVPAPVVTEKGAVRVLRWRVDSSPAAPVEPNSPPVTEFLPSVQVGWGLSLEQRLTAVRDVLADNTPVDPRISAIARSLVQKVPAGAITERAKRLYRWVLGNIEEGEELDGRRVVMGRQGNRWRGFVALCRALGIKTEYALAKNRLAEEPTGPISRATQYNQPLLRLRAEKGPLWLTFENRYAPFGYVPAEVRGMPAFLLSDGKPERLSTPPDGVPDGIRYDGSAKLKPDGSAEIDLNLSFQGKYAVALRKWLSEVPERNLHGELESKLLGQSLQGARLMSFKIDHFSDLDLPLFIRMRAETSSFAQPAGDSLIISPPFTPRLSQLATLPERQTPLLIGEATDHRVHLNIETPAGARVQSPVLDVKIRDGARQVVVSDRVKDNRLTLDRSIALPAGRVQPEDYRTFLEFARRADNALSSSIRLRVR